MIVLHENTDCQLSDRARYMWYSTGRQINGLKLCTSTKCFSCSHLSFDFNSTKQAAICIESKEKTCYPSTWILAIQVEPYKDSVSCRQIISSTHFELITTRYDFAIIACLKHFCLPPVISINVKSTASILICYMYMVQGIGN
jgi:hypothetical protein